MRALLAGLLCACAARPAPPRETTPPGEVFVAAGERFPAGTRVVRWDEPGGFDAYRPGEARDGDAFGTRPGNPHTMDELRGVVRQVVLHYDVCGTSARCFAVLRRRGLSCHFLVDADGTVYQTLDLKERAWHAGFANDGSIGIEIAQIGAYPDPSRLEDWYAADGSLRFPAGVPLGALRPEGLRTARPGVIRGQIHGVRLYQRDFTDAQYDALVRLLAGLVRAFPLVRPETPRGADGRVLRTVLGPREQARAFRGVLAHYHLTRGKVDPGPAFDWRRVLGGVLAQLPDRPRRPETHG